jgi:hypothetical protein
MRYVLLLCVLVMSFTSPVAAQADCGLESRFSSGMAGWVLPGSPNRARADPSRQSLLIDTLEAGKAFEVIGEAVCAENITWIPIKFTTRDDGSWQGWTAESDASEYFLEPVSGTLISAYGVTAIVPLEIDASVEITRHEKEPETVEDTWTLPEYIQITVTSDNEENEGTITIYRTDVVGPDDQDNMWTGSFRNTIDVMAIILENRSDLTIFDPIYNRLPLFGIASATNLLAYRDYLPFQNGDGYHSLASWGQMIFEPNNGSLEYNYVGLTNDGRYFVHAELPINASELPDESVPPVDLDSDEMGAYLKRNGEFFDALPPESYTPSLTLLDALINSLYIGD